MSSGSIDSDSVLSEADQQEETYSSSKPSSISPPSEESPNPQNEIRPLTPTENVEVVTITPQQANQTVTNEVPPNVQNTENENDQGFSLGRMLWNGTKWVGIHLYNIAYATGGWLSDFLGITSPRYGYVIREYEEMQRRQAQREQEAAMGTATPEENPNANDQVHAEA